MDDKNNLLEKLGIVAKKEDSPAPKKKAAANPRPKAAAAPETKPLANKYSSDDLAVEYEQMLKERATMAKQIKELEAKTAAPAVAPAPAAPKAAPKAQKPAVAPKPVQAVAPKPIAETPKEELPSAGSSTYTYHDTDEFSHVADIYASQGKDLNGVNAIYVVDSFVGTLPDNLADDVKKDVLLRILTVSNIEPQELLADGEARMKILSSYSEDFKAHTKEYVSSRTTEVSLLEEQIRHLKKEIMDRNKLQAKQTAEIAAETSKISANMMFLGHDSAQAAEQFWSELE